VGHRVHIRERKGLGPTSDISRFPSEKLEKIYFPSKALIGFSVYKIKRNILYIYFTQKILCTQKDDLSKALDLISNPCTTQICYTDKMEARWTLASRVRLIARRRRGLLVGSIAMGSGAEFGLVGPGF
jgi:hypothetical protein